MTPSNPDDARYTLTELADLAGVTPRTVRYYLAQGLLPAVGVAGPGAKYDDTHLARLRVIRRLQREHQPLAEIRRRLEALGDADVLAIAAEPAPEPPSDSALDYIRRVTASAPIGVREAPAVYRPALPRRMRSYEPSSLDIPAAPAAPAIAPMPPSTALPPGVADTPLVPPYRIERSQWERVVLGPDVELHIRRPLPRSTAKRVDRLVEIARDLLEEDHP